MSPRQREDQPSLGRGGSTAASTAKLEEATGLAALGSDDSGLAALGSDESGLAALGNDENDESGL
eukprot:4559807-Pleurochrysis_carterae.AAC.1